MDEREIPLRPADAVVAGLVAVVALLIVGATTLCGREYAKRALCSVNLAKLHAAMSQYLADNDDEYCPADVCFVDMAKVKWEGCPYHDPQIIRINDETGGLLWHYLGTGDVLACETFKRWNELYWNGNPLRPSWQFEPPFGYSQNVYPGGPNAHSPLPGVRRSSDVVAPENVLVFAEETIWLIPGLARWILNDTMFFARHTNDPTSIGDTIATYHKMKPPRIYQGMGNVVFVDGHVELCDPWIRHEYEWGFLTESFYLAWPKEKVFTSAAPY